MMSFLKVDKEIADGVYSFASIILPKTEL